MDATAMSVRSTDAGDSMSFHAKAANRGFTIGIMSAQRHRKHQGALRGMHSITVGSEKFGSEGVVNSPRPWISLNSVNDASVRLPQLWKGACNVR